MHYDPQSNNFIRKQGAHIACLVSIMYKTMIPIHSLIPLWFPGAKASPVGKGTFFGIGYGKMYMDMLKLKLLDFQYFEAKQKNTPYPIVMIYIYIYIYSKLLIFHSTVLDRPLHSTVQSGICSYGHRAAKPLYYRSIVLQMPCTTHVSDISYINHKHNSWHKHNLMNPILTMPCINIHGWDSNPPNMVAHLLGIPQIIPLELSKKCQQSMPITRFFVVLF